MPLSLFAANEQNWFRQSRFAFSSRKRLRLPSSALSCQRHPGDTASLKHTAARLLPIPLWTRFGISEVMDDRWPILVSPFTHLLSSPPLCIDFGLPIQEGGRELTIPPSPPV